MFVSSVSMQYIVSIAKFGHKWSIWRNHLLWLSLSYLWDKSILEREYFPYLTCHVMYLLTQNVWPWQDLNLHRSRRDSNPQCLDPSSNALSYATRLLYRLSYTAGSNLMLKDTVWSRRLQPVLLPVENTGIEGRMSFFSHFSLQSSDV